MPNNKNSASAAVKMLACLFQREVVYFHRLRTYLNEALTVRHHVPYIYYLHVSAMGWTYSAMNSLEC